MASASPPSTPSVVNLLEMASAALSSAVSASLSIRGLAEPDKGEKDAKNARLKADGSFVTDADFAAQSIITSAVQRVSANVRILGEESPEGVAKVPQDRLEHESDTRVYANCRKEIFLRFKSRQSQSSSAPATDQSLPLSPSSAAAAAAEDNTDSNLGNEASLFELSEEEKSEVIVDVSRVCVIIDPLDGTKSYAKGDYDAVSILISVNLDFQPHFGVICKPFGYDGIPSIMDSQCAAVYGGPLVGGGFMAGGEALVPSNKNQSTELPRAIISSSRSKGVVGDVCKQLGTLGVIQPEPLHISGAGEKSLRLVLRRQNEGLWFFPKSGTSLWDIAASDAILRSMGGKVTDKHGHQLDYSKSRDEADNEDGVIACSDDKLHAECMRVFQEGTWEE